MTRAPRNAKRSPTPTSATFSPVEYNSNSTPPSPVVAAPKPLYLCSPFVEAALVKGNFKTIVMLPKYVDIMEWVAVNSASLFLLTTGVATDDYNQSLTFIPISMNFTESSLNAVHSRLVQRCLQALCMLLSRRLYLELSTSIQIELHLDQPGSQERPSSSTNLYRLCHDVGSKSSRR